jgi:DNA primase
LLLPGLIPRPFIDDLLARTDIVEVISRRLQLKRQGREFSACCPFHNEKTPSFYVNPNKQFYHCFGCGASGTALTFLMEYEHLGFVEAVEELAKAQGMTVPHEGGERSARRDSHHSDSDLMLKIARLYQQQLKNSSIAIEYLRQRGLSGEICQDFAIGYAPEGWDFLLRTFANDRDALLRQGMVIEAEGRTWDRFRSRITFPIRNRKGQVIAFGGRIIGDGKPKYLNSPETTQFHKGQELYGLYEVLQAQRNITRLLVVEGYMDVVALAQHGIRYAVATLGTSVTPEHLQLMFRYCDDIIFCFDGDRAGREAAWRALNNALPLMQGDKQLRFMFLPEGEDPDSLVRQEGRDDFESRYAQALTLSDYLFDRIREGSDLSRMDGRVRYLKQVAPLVKQIPPGIYRQMIIEELATIGKMSIPELSQGLQLAATGQQLRRQPPPSHARERQRPSLIRTAIACLIQQPRLAQQVTTLNTLRQLQLPGIDLFVRLVELTQAEPDITLPSILEYFRDEDAGRHLAKLASHPLISDEATDIGSEFAGALHELERQSWRQRHDELMLKLGREGVSPEEAAEYQQLIQRMRQGRN